MKKNTSLLFTLSSVFEYYDFIIYGFMSTYLGVIFFPNQDELVSQLQAFSVFALGYVARPLGGIIFGLLGDFKGRKTSFIKSNIVLAIATASIGLLPDYNQIGISATIMLICLRLIQALSFAAELPGAMTLIGDTEKEPSKSFSFVVSGGAIGSILGSLGVYLLEQYFDRQEILDFAWRIPFIFGALLCIIGLVMRNSLMELKAIEKLKSKDLFDNVFPQYKKIISFVFIIATPAYLIIMNVFFPSFLPKFYGYDVKEVHLAISLSLLWTVFYAPIFTTITNSITRVNLLQNVLLIAIFLFLLINYFLLRQNFSSLVLALCVYQSIISSVMVVVFPLMVEVFPKNTRFTLIATCYNITYPLISFAPILITNLSLKWGSPIILWLSGILLVLFALANIANLQEE
jgi:MFS family permease